MFYIHEQEGLTPLHIACQQGHLSIVQLLLQVDTDINVKSNVRIPIWHYISVVLFEIAKSIFSCMQLGVNFYFFIEWADCCHDDSDIQTYYHP